MCVLTPTYTSCLSPLAPAYSVGAESSKININCITPVSHIYTFTTVYRNFSYCILYFSLYSKCCVQVPWYTNVRFKILIMTLLKIWIFWDVSLHGETSYQHFEWARVKCAEKKCLVCLTLNIMAIQDIMWHTRRLESLNGLLHGLLYALWIKRLLFYQPHFCWFLIQICYPHQCVRHTHLSDVAIDVSKLSVSGSCSSGV